MYGKSWIYTAQKEWKCHDVWSCILTEKLVKFSEVQIKLKNKSNFLKLEENSVDYILNQEVILLGENQETKPDQEKKKLLHVNLWLHSISGASGSRDLRGAQASPWLGVMAAPWAGVPDDFFSAKWEWECPISESSGCISVDCRS